MSLLLLSSSFDSISLVLDNKTEVGTGLIVEIGIVNTNGATSTLIFCGGKLRVNSATGSATAATVIVVVVVVVDKDDDKDDAVIGTSLFSTSGDVDNFSNSFSTCGVTTCSIATCGVDTSDDCLATDGGKGIDESIITAVDTIGEGNSIVGLDADANANADESTVGIDDADADANDEGVNAGKGGNDVSVGPR